MGVLAFALGTPLRGDDAAGLAMARGLPELLAGLTVIEATELLPEHAEAVAGAAGVIFLDASSASAPGEVRAERLAPRTPRGTLAHAYLPEEILGLAQILFGRAPPAVLITIGGKDFSFGMGLSPEVEDALPLARQVACEQIVGFAP